MRYIKPPEFKSVKDLQGYYKKVENDITELLTTDGSARTAKELNDKLSQALSAAMSYLTTVNRRFANNELATAFKEGQDGVKGERKISETEAAAILAKQGYKYAKNGFSKDVYIELQTATKNSLKGVETRVNDVINKLRKNGQDSIYNVQQAIIKDYSAHGIFKVEYSNGAEQPLHAYAAMAARSARIESMNIGAIGSALQEGTDLVEMTTMPQCCKLCGAYQGKVYSISGKDKRFPALFKTVLSNGYALPHPNCRHEFIPYFEELEDPADVEKAIRKSKIKYDSKGQLIDVRFQKDIKAYQAWQAGNRQLNAEYLEFERMRQHYAGREDEMPYKTLAGFRRARRARAMEYKEYRKVWGAMRETPTNSLTDWRLSGKIGKEPNPNAKADCAVSWKFINKKVHKDRLAKFVGDNIVGKTVSKIEAEILKHRQGTEYEDLYLIDVRTGKTVAKNVNSPELLKVGKNKEMSDILSANDKKKYALVHNHPYSSPPSIADINSLFKNQKIKYGVIIGHNGTVYKYTAPNAEIAEEDLAISIKHYRKMNYSQRSAEEMAYKDLVKKFNFSLEVLKSEKE